MLLFSLFQSILYLQSVVGNPEYDASWPQVSRQMPKVDLKWVGRCCLSIDMPIHCHAWVYITCWEIPAENCQWKEISSYPITDLYFNQEPIRLHHGPLEILNPFLLTSFNIAFRRVQTCYHYFSYFSVVSNEFLWHVIKIEIQVY